MSTRRINVPSQVNITYVIDLLNAKANVSDLTTANVVELTNLYYSNARTYSNVITLLPTLAGSGIAIAAQFGPRTELIQCRNGLADGVWWHWMADQVALGFGAVQFGKSLQLTNTFNTLGNHVEAK